MKVYFETQRGRTLDDVIDDVSDYVIDFDVSDDVINLQSYCSKGRYCSSGMYYVNVKASSC